MYGVTYGKIHFIKQKLINYVVNFFPVPTHIKFTHVDVKVGQGSTFTFTDDLPYIVYKIYMRTQAKIMQQLKSFLTENVRL